MYIEEKKFLRVICMFDMKEFSYNMKEEDVYVGWLMRKKYKIIMFFLFHFYIPLDINLKKCFTNIILSTNSNDAMGKF